MLKNTLKKNVEPYFALASIYDDVMEHVDYKRWATYVHKILQKFDHQTDWILDISCGTGSCAKYLQKLDYHVVGSDSSWAMLQQAQIKAGFEGRDICFFCADMCAQPLKKQPNVIISLYDSMNYLPSDRVWQTCISDVYNSLQSGGLFIFDVSTLRNSMNDFANYRQKENVPGGSFVRESTFDNKINEQKNYFEISLDEFPGVLFCETHTQIIRPLDEIFAFVEHSPFTLLAAYKNFTFQTYTEKSERVHFVLQKDESASC